MMLIDYEVQEFMELLNFEKNAAEDRTVCSFETAYQLTP